MAVEEKFVSGYNSYAGTLAKAILLIENSDVAGAYYKTLGTALQSLILAGNSISTGTDTVALLGAIQTLENKTISAEDNDISDIGNNEIMEDASIAWDKIGETNHLTDAIVGYLANVNEDVQEKLDLLSANTYRAPATIQKTSDGSKLVTISANEIKQALGISSGDYAKYNVDAINFFVSALYESTTGTWHLATNTASPIEVKCDTTTVAPIYDYVDSVVITAGASGQRVRATFSVSLITI